MAYIKIVMKNQKTLNALRKKANGKGRMPSLNKVSELLTELGIENSCMEWSEVKWRDNGLRYNTSGGSRTYNGYTLRVAQINMDICSTDSYYSWNTMSYAQQLIKLIDTL